MPHDRRQVQGANKAIYIYSASRGWVLYPWTGLEIRKESERRREKRRGEEGGRQRGLAFGKYRG